MHKRRLVSALLVLFTLAASAARADTTPPIGADAFLGDHYPERRTSFPGDVTGLADLTYAAPAGFRPLTLDLYMVNSGAAARPLVIYIHGGGWMGGHSRQAGAFENWPEVLASLAAKGYVVASLNYRLSGEARFPAAIQDVKTAIRWLRANAETYHIDKTRVAIWGGSAGGQLAALAATSCGVAALAPPDAPAESDCVQAGVTWYGVFDFEHFVRRPGAEGAAANPAASAETRYFGCTPDDCPPGLIHSAGAVAYVGPNTPPFLMIHGANDKVVPHDQSDDFYTLLKAKKLPAELMIIPDVGHSFIGTTQPVTQTASLAALRKTFDFFDTTIGAKRK